MIENEPIKLTNSKIHLSGLEFYAHHGCFQEERQVGAHFVIDVVFEYDATQTARADDITQAVNYQDVYLDIKEIMKVSVNLLETLCYECLSMLKEKYPKITHAEVTVCKMSPALGGKTEAVSVTAGY